MEEDKKIYTSLNLEEMVEKLRGVIKRMAGIMPIEQEEIKTMLEEIIGQKYQDGHWCPPTCNPSDSDMKVDGSLMGPNRQ